MKGDYTGVLRNLCRLLSYTRKYWVRLTIGVVAGTLVGGSIFVTLMMIPQMVGVVNESISVPVKKISAKKVSAEEAVISGEERLKND